jgi:cytochrome c biogenesis protein CcmG/thiol:disulfide interchange protein DsbE
VVVALVALVLALVLALGGCSSEVAAKKQPDRLPDATFASLDGGRPVKLSTLRGPMVINLWASWCKPCRKELPQYEAFAKKYAGKVRVIGIDFQETRVGAATRLAHDAGVDYPLYADPDGRMRARFMPKVILLDGDGRIAHQTYTVISSVSQLEALVRKHLEVAG